MQDFCALDDRKQYLLWISVTFKFFLLHGRDLNTQVADIDSKDEKGK